MSNKDKPSKPPSGEDIYIFRKTFPELSWKDVGIHYGEPLKTVKNREFRYRKKQGLPGLAVNQSKRFIDDISDKPKIGGKHKLKFTEKGFKAEIYSESDRIRSLDELLSASNTDLGKWKVARHIINVWEGGRKKKVVDLTWNNGVMDGFVEDSGDWQLTDFWQVKAFLEPREEEPYEEALKALIEKVEKYAPVYEPSLFSYKAINDGYLLIPNLYDAHFGKRSHRSRRYTLETARSDFIKIAKAIAAQIYENPKIPSQIMFPIGHDLLHVDNVNDKTSWGTWVEMSADIREAVDMACDAAVTSIETFATVAPVEVIPVEGNHDRLMTYWMGKYLQAFFSKHPNVKVRDMKLERQYYQWGRVGIGLTHDGSKPQELATLFPIEARYMWPDIEWTEWLTGHFHHKRNALYAVDSVRGTVVRTIPGLCDMDNYHSLHLYVGAHRAADVLYYHSENGPAGSFPIFVSELS
jgi:hypothetical protein